MAKRRKAGRYLVFHKRKTGLEFGEDDRTVHVYEEMDTFKDLYKAREFAITHLPSAIGRELPVSSESIMATEFELPDGEVVGAVNPEAPFIVASGFGKEYMDGHVGEFRVYVVYSDSQGLNRIVESYARKPDLLSMHACLGIDIFSGE